MGRDRSNLTCVVLSGICSLRCNCLDIPNLFVCLLWSDQCIWTDDWHTVCDLGPVLPRPHILCKLILIPLHRYLDHPNSNTWKQIEGRVCNFVVYWSCSHSNNSMQGVCLKYLSSVAAPVTSSTVDIDLDNNVNGCWYALIL